MSDSSNGPKERGAETATDRRRFLATTGDGFFAATCASLAGRPVAYAERLLATRFAELPPAEVERRLAELERSLSARYGKAISVADDAPLDGVQFGYGLDLSRCIGCRRCVYACVHENNQSRSPQVHWIRVLGIEKEKGIDLLESEPYYNPATVPEEGRFYVGTVCSGCYSDTFS